MTCTWYNRTVSSVVLARLSLSQHTSQFYRYWYHTDTIPVPGSTNLLSIPVAVFFLGGNKRKSRKPLKKQRRHYTSTPHKTSQMNTKQPTDQTKPLKRSKSLLPRFAAIDHTTSHSTHKRSKSLLSSRPTDLPLEVWKSGISSYLGLRDICLSAATCKTLDLASKFCVEHNISTSVKVPAAHWNFNKFKKSQRKKTFGLFASASKKIRSIDCYSWC